MKKTIAYLVAMAVVSTLAACTNNKDEENSAPVESGSIVEAGENSLETYQQALVGTDNLCAVSLLGWFEGENAELPAFFDEITDDDKFDFIGDISEERIVRASGGETYLVIPSPDVKSVTVNEWIFDESNDFAGRAGEVLYSSEKPEPFLLICNVSEIMPNTLITMTDGEKTLSHSLSVSLKDGSVVVPLDVPTIKDLTVNEY